MCSRDSGRKKQQGEEMTKMKAEHEKEIAALKQKLEEQARVYDEHVEGLMKHFGKWRWRATDSRR